MKGEITIKYSHKGIRKADYVLLIKLYDDLQKQVMTIDENVLIEGKFSRWKN